MIELNVRNPSLEIVFLKILLSSGNAVYVPIAPKFFVVSLYVIATPPFMSVFAKTFELLVRETELSNADHSTFFDSIP